jgi:hypothetical protein
MSGATTSASRVTARYPREPSTVPKHVVWPTSKRLVAIHSQPRICPRRRLRHPPPTTASIFLQPSISLPTRQRRHLEVSICLPPAPTTTTQPPMAPTLHHRQPPGRHRNEASLHLHLALLWHRMRLRTSLVSRIKQHRNCPLMSDPSIRLET